MAGERIIVCGGRYYSDSFRIAEVLDEIAPSAIAHGGATGADSLAMKWSFRRKVPCRIFRADWEAHARAAGPIRNAKMLQEFDPDLVVAFPGGRGTADMVRRAKEAGVKVIEVHD